ncbi:MAG: hypothetical protein EA389_09655 [Ilumatobacter sp.]|nr:MAG: hypothetical protein EA389_09655 [Ilumatobacter sp.]
MAGVAITGLVGAAAASLGGLNIESLGADDAIVAACDDDGIDVAFTTSHDGDSFVVDSVDFSGVDDACDGLDYVAVLTGFDEVAEETIELARANDTATSGSFSASFAGEGVLAEDVLGISLVISG